MGTGSFPGVKCGRGVLLTTHPLPVPRSWKSSAIPLPTFWAGSVTGTYTLKFYHVQSSGQVATNAKTFHQIKQHTSVCSRVNRNPINQIQINPLKTGLHLNAIQKWISTSESIHSFSAICKDTPRPLSRPIGLCCRRYKRCFSKYNTKHKEIARKKLNFLMLKQMVYKLTTGF